MAYKRLWNPELLNMVDMWCDVMKKDTQGFLQGNNYKLKVQKVDFQR